MFVSILPDSWHSTSLAALFGRFKNENYSTKLRLFGLKNAGRWKHFHFIHIFATDQQCSFFLHHLRRNTYSTYQLWPGLLDVTNKRLKIVLCVVIMLCACETHLNCWYDELSIHTTNSCHDRSHFSTSLSAHTKTQGSRCIPSNTLDMNCSIFIEYFIYFLFE